MSDSQCPFCGSVLRNEARQVVIPLGAKRAVLFAIGLGAAVPACGALVESEPEMNAQAIYGAVVAPSDSLSMPEPPGPEATASGQMTAKPGTTTPSATTPATASPGPDIPTPSISGTASSSPVIPDQEYGQPVYGAPFPPEPDVVLEQGVGGAPDDGAFDAGSASIGGARDVSDAGTDAGVPDAGVGTTDGDDTAAGGAQSMPGPQPPYGAPPQPQPVYGAPPSQQ